MIDHKAEALSHVNGFTQGVDSFVALAQVHAILYLAEQQRVANIITLSQSPTNLIGAGIYMKTDSATIFDLVKETLSGEG